MVNAAVGEKGAQGIRPCLTIDVATKSSPRRWAIAAEREPAVISVCHLSNSAQLHLLRRSITFIRLSPCTSASGQGVYSPAKPLSPISCIQPMYALTSEGS
jgi:hypothetical protein